ncbi:MULTISPECIES: PIN domain-containing protein [unclassified Methanoregula]|uniref:PIN domain-containing protein n=1 Tax=unclassified Methanoregula TaxID=2649730 RepID=UPI0009CB438B|nr:MULTISPECIES: PIN domain-containing protein [unclassified Methanoregula]OPX62203.1 MAG: putative nucleotide-binding protein, containing PIN domain [Methanoregula sp. PtaB.Bin085]OPY35588.1 MAG: putative nucleotide-binding protein, containing PIN domain [Methanoregula sp. PtaU1.Bin006]
MRLVIDTNRIMAGLLKDSTSRRIILHRSFSFFAPDYCETELLKHRQYLMKKAKITEQDFDNLMQILLERVVLVPFEDFESEYLHAIQVMEPVDENDAPFLAVGLALGISRIWTEDRHFLKQDFLNVCTTRDLIGMI